MAAKTIGRGLTVSRLPRGICKTKTRLMVLGMEVTILPYHPPYGLSHRTRTPFRCQVTLCIPPWHTRHILLPPPCFQRQTQARISTVSDVVSKGAEIISGVGEKNCMHTSTWP